MDSQPRTFSISGHAVRVMVGDVASLPNPVDALVSSDDNYLSHGGGVSRALWSAAGPELDRFVEAAQPPLRLGDVFVTPGFHLSSRVLLHAVTIDLDRNRSIVEPELAKLYQRVFEVAGAAQCADVALPLLGAGAAGVSPRASAISLVDTLTSGAPRFHGVQTITLVLHAPEDGVAVEIFDAADRRERDLERAVGDLIASTTGELAQSWRQAWHQYLSGEPAARGVALALLFGHISDLLQEDGAGGRADRHQVSRDAWAARNRLAHGRGHWDAHDWSTLLEAVRDGLMVARLRQQSVNRAEARPTAAEPFESAPHSGASPTPADADQKVQVRWGVHSHDADAFEANSDQTLIFASRSVLPTEAIEWSYNLPVSSKRAWSTPPAAEPEAAGRRGTTPLRELRDFLSAYLPEPSREDLRRRFVAHGYKGPEDIQLLEFLIQEPDPARFLASEFGRPLLLDAIRKFRREEPPDWPTAERLARWFLKTLGFPDPVRPDGLKAVRQAVQRARTTLLVHDDGGLRGAVADVARRLEYVARVLLRFVAQAAYRTAPEMLLRRWGRLTETQDLAKAGLGQLLIWIEVLDSHLAKDTLPEVVLFKRDVAPASLLPSGTKGIAALRNAFSHWRPQDASSSVAEQGRKFLDEADAFLEYLSRPDCRVFPRIILIEGVHFDGWGRKVIHAVDDEGNQERIFTEDVVVPGETYFMHPLTNPIRVDPILVPAGDLLWVST